jgi:hypothetical protein
LADGLKVQVADNLQSGFCGSTPVTGAAGPGDSLSGKYASTVALAGGVAVTSTTGGAKACLINITYKSTGVSSKIVGGKIKAYVFSNGTIGDATNNAGTNDVTKFIPKAVI